MPEHDEQPIMNKVLQIWKDDDDIFEALNATQTKQLMDLLRKLAFRGEDTEISTIRNPVVRLAYSRIGGKCKAHIERYFEKVKTNRQAGSLGGQTTAQKEFVPPTQQEVVEYCEKIDQFIDVPQYMEQYTANGWTTKGGKPVRNWKALVKAWHKNNPLKINDFYERLDLIDENSREARKINEFFEACWAEYPNQKGKDRISMTQKRKLMNEVGLDEMLRAIARYRDEVGDKDPEWIKHGDTFFNVHYVDYLDNAEQRQTSWLD